MKKDLTLVILAAGMGSRFGGLKQIEPIGPNGEFIIDYSIYDAIKAGFTKVIFIIKEENYEVFRETVGKRVEKYIKTEYVFQKLENVPFEIPKSVNRIKPWGTAHALYSAKDTINENFALISADDFYGRNSFELLAKALKDSSNFYVIGYKIKECISENGSVKRGVCFEEDGYVTTILESKVSVVNGKIIGEPLNGQSVYEIDEEQPVSMLMYGLTKEIIDYIEKRMVSFFEKHKEELESVEFLLPDILDEYVVNDIKPIKLIPTDEKWYGVTYKEDQKYLQGKIKQKIKEGTYPEKLW